MIQLCGQDHTNSWEIYLTVVKTICYPQVFAGKKKPPAKSWGG